MKKKVLVGLLGLLVICTSMVLAPQKDGSLYNTKDGYAVEGYDVVAYFNEGPTKGNVSFEKKYQGVKYKFSSKKNLNLFNENPQMYLPQYGGWCAYAMGQKEDKVSVNPNTFEVRDSKLYLFYDSWGNNTLKKWIKEGPKKLQKQANINWIKIKRKG
jgi:YHS domain-containing protein